MYVYVYVLCTTIKVGKQLSEGTFTVLLEDNCCNIWIAILAHKVLLSTNSKQT